MFRRKEKQGTYDRKSLKPVIRSSICTGEQTAGFKNLHTGKFSEIVLIRSSRNLEEFQRTYGISDGEITTEY